MSASNELSNERCRVCAGLQVQGGLYGAFIYATTDGGASWTRQHYAYEV